MPKKSAAATAPAKTVSAAKRQLKSPRRRRFQRTPKAERPLLRLLPSGRVILRQAWRLLWSHRAVFGRIGLMYGLAYLVLVQGLSSNVDVQSIKDQVTTNLEGPGGQVASNVSVLGYLLSSSVGTGAYQLMLLILLSLAIIWTLRQASAGHHVTMRAAYYRGMYPLIPFILVGLRAVIQLVPFAIGAVLFNIVSAYGIATTWFELLIWGVGAILLTAWSVYMVLPSLIGLYVVTLPNMTPLKAVRSARQLVHYRRWNIVRKLLLLAVVVLLGLAVVMLPVIMFAAPAAVWVFFGLTLFVWPVVHAFCYELYRELINHA